MDVKTKKLVHGDYDRCWEDIQLELKKVKPLAERTKHNEMVSDDILKKFIKANLKKYNCIVDVRSSVSESDGLLYHVYIVNGETGEIVFNTYVKGFYEMKCKIVIVLVHLVKNGKVNRRTYG